MLKPYEMNAFIEEAGVRKPFHLRISEPNRTPGEDDYFCLVHAPCLFARDKKIFGINEQQAHKLALEFIEQMLGERKLFNANGDPIEIGK